MNGSGTERLGVVYKHSCLTARWSVGVSTGLSSSREFQEESFTMMWSKTSLCVLVVLAAAVLSPSSALPSSELNDYIDRITPSGDVDGYDTATVYAVDPSSNVEIRQTKRDIETHATDSASDKRTFSLQLASGDRLRMSLDRRSVDTSGAKFTALTEDGEREIILQSRNCFFSGPLEEEEGFAALAMCNGKLTGTISTSKRDYDIHALPQTSHKREADDDMHVLVTWRQKGHDKRDFDDEDDAWEIPDDEAEEDNDKRSVADRTATVEIADYVDRYYIETLRTKMNLVTDEEITNFIIGKWTSVAYMLSDQDRVGWNMTLRLVSVVLMRTDPDFYQTKPFESIGARMDRICKGTKKEKYDHVTLHTRETSDARRRVGLSYVGTVCSPRWRCAASIGYSYNFMVELHEFGHSLGLYHDWSMKECKDGSDRTRGFMGANRDHFRLCYRKIFDKQFTRKSKRCLFTENFKNYVQVG